MLCTSLLLGELGRGSAKRDFVEQGGSRFCGRGAAPEDFGEKQVKALKCKVKAIKMSGCGVVVGNLGCDRRLVFALPGVGGSEGSAPQARRGVGAVLAPDPLLGSSRDGGDTIEMLHFFKVGEAGQVY